MSRKRGQGRSGEQVGVSFELRGDRKSEETEFMIGDPELAPISVPERLTALIFVGALLFRSDRIFFSFYFASTFLFLLLSFFSLTQDHRLKSSLTRYLSFMESTALAIPMCVSRALYRF